MEIWKKMWVGVIFWTQCIIYYYILYYYVYFCRTSNLNGTVFCADVPLRNYSLTYSLVSHHLPGIAYMTTRSPQLYRSRNTSLSLLNRKCILPVEELYLYDTASKAAVKLTSKALKIVLLTTEFDGLLFGKAYVFRYHADPQSFDGAGNSGHLLSRDHQ